MKEEEEQGWMPIVVQMYPAVFRVLVFLSLWKRKVCGRDTKLVCELDCRARVFDI